MQCVNALQLGLSMGALTGLGAVASYGAISNVTYGGGLAIAWIAFVRQFAKSPLMAGQWKAFLAFYAGDSIASICSCTHVRMPGSSIGVSCSLGGLQLSWAYARLVFHAASHHTRLMKVDELCAGFWTIQNFVRPLRFSLALALAPVFERFLSTISRSTKLSKRNAFGIYLFILGSVTSTLVFGSIYIFAGPLAYARG